MYVEVDIYIATCCNLKNSIERKRNKIRSIAQYSKSKLITYTHRGFPGGAVVKNPPANAGDTGSRPGPGRSHMPRSN